MGFVREALHWHGLTGRGRFALAVIPVAGLVAAQTQAPPLSIAGAGISLVSALAIMLFFGHARRRLRAMGWSGKWMWALVVPLLSLILVIVMLARRTRPEAAPGPFNRGGRALVWGLVALMASRALWAPFIIPTGSMSPTLQPGDYVLATRRFAAPRRGDVVIFRHPVSGQDFLKRVIGLPGDTVQMRDGLVILNGTPVPQATAPDWTEPYRATAMGTRPLCVTPVIEGDICSKLAAIETLPGGPSYTVLDVGGMATDFTALVEIPEGFAFVLGDNRDNSLDSRIAQSAGGVGLVPVAAVAGRVRLVLYSREGRDGRVLRTVE
ncbi:signal peptidase I [Antarctobacter heliothermus]|uniref:Signal peptidase I n=1 Tax=Antarctobacter heliothermus TaxID=74033 RepID=A0A239F4X6_9RHOB|nr:signal peptidase I [Antarctobacter heliothermus]SNS51949.1 signal peptidase I [Antarctobacter heliothermus]